MMIEKQLTALVLLAKSDETLDERELDFIYKIGRANCLEDDQIQQIIDNPGEIGSLGDLNDDEKFDFLYNVIHLMKVDDEIFNSEIDYCNQIAVKLGYGMGAVMEMYPKVHKNLVIKQEKEALKKKVRGFLN